MMRCVECEMDGVTFCANMTITFISAYEIS